MLARARSSSPPSSTRSFRVHLPCAISPFIPAALVAPPPRRRTARAVSSPSAHDLLAPARSAHTQPRISRTARYQMRGRWGRLPHFPGLSVTYSRRILPQLPGHTTPVRSHHHVPIRDTRLAAVLCADHLAHGSPSSSRAELRISPRRTPRILDRAV